MNKYLEAFDTYVNKALVDHKSSQRLSDKSLELCKKWMTGQEIIELEKIRSNFFKVYTIDRGHFKRAAKETRKKIQLRLKSVGELE